MQGSPFASAAALLAAAATASACITHSPRRTYDNINPGASLPAYCSPSKTPEDVKRDVACGIDAESNGNDSACTSIKQLIEAGDAGDLHRQKVSCVSHERHERIENSATSLPHAGFDLHVLEFDDEGQPWNRIRQERTFEVIRQQLREPAVVVGFVHGWKNDASVCNGNLSCFRDVLEILAKAETAYTTLAPPDGARAAGEKPKPRRVIGIYFGWRGGTIKAKYVKQLTFWGRKHTAHTIGDNGGVTNAIERVRSIINNARPPGFRTAAQSVRTTSLVWVGHSFGAALLYSALATSLNAAVGEALEGASATARQRGANETGLPKEIARPSQTRPPEGRETVARQVPTFGDLVVLVNPAMEASRFANLSRVSELQFQPRQMPMFVTLASEGDGAVGGFFPIGQAFATISRAARSREIWLSMVKGFGLYQPYHTHRLIVKPPDDKNGDIPRREQVSGECRCKSNLGKFGDALVKRLLNLYKARFNENVAQHASYQEMLYSRLEPVRDVDPNTPFIMASVDPAVVADHNDIFNPIFVDFLMEFVVRNEIKRGLANDYGQERAQ